MSSETESVGPRQKILNLAKEFLAGKSGVIETARALAPLRHEVDSELNAILLTFTGIDSETDTLPVGHVRAYWAPDALERKDREIAEAENSYRDLATAAAIELVQLLEGTH